MVRWKLGEMEDEERWEVREEGRKVVTVITLVHRPKVVAATNHKFSAC